MKEAVPRDSVYFAILTNGHVRVGPWDESESVQNWAWAVNLTTRNRDLISPMKRQMTKRINYALWKENNPNSMDAFEFAAWCAIKIHEYEETQRSKVH